MERLSLTDVQPLAYHRSSAIIYNGGEDLLKQPDKNGGEGALDLLRLWSLTDTG